MSIFLLNNLINFAKIYLVNGMSLRFIYGKAGTGKSTFCFNEIKENIKNKEKIYIITPEQFSYSAEKRLLEVLENYKESDIVWKRANDYSCYN